MARQNKKLLSENKIHQILEDYRSGWSEQTVAELNLVSRRQVRKLVKTLGEPSIEEHKSKMEIKHQQWQQSAILRMYKEPEMTYRKAYKMSKEHSRLGRIARANPNFERDIIRQIKTEGSP